MPTADVQRLAIGTDGIIHRDTASKELSLVSTEQEALFEYQAAAPAGLQWWLNKQQNRHNRFSDDTTIITLSRK
jgi:hypothetical protein